jgi:hypothetical protein
LALLAVHRARIDPWSAALGLATDDAIRPDHLPLGRDDNYQRFDTGASVVQLHA